MRRKEEVGTQRTHAMTGKSIYYRPAFICTVLIGVATVIAGYLSLGRWVTNLLDLAWIISFFWFAYTLDRQSESSHR
jgi:hypothetical protein